MMQTRVFEQLITLSGRRYVIREAGIPDAPQLLAHARSILAEPAWNITELQEFQFTIDREEAWILSFGQRPHSILLVADFGTPETPQVVGMVALQVQGRFRMRHRGRLGIGVQASYRRQGVGEVLLRTLLLWAEAEPELERIELGVFAHNARARNLYRKLGFQEEAHLSRAYKLADGSYYDDILMVKWVKSFGQE